MKRTSLRHRTVTLAWIAIICTFAATGAAARELPTDSRNASGKLDNGVTWVYRQHSNPPGKMALMIHVDTGSLNESEAQRGLAHFVEHMAFNGSEHYKPGELIPYFESIGMEFGADLNAFTSFDQTAYMLFTPDTKPESISDALKVLSDFAFRVSFLDEEIEKERGVVLEESRSGKGAQERIREKLWPELFEGSRFAKRLPIGLDEVISNAPRKEFVDYYNTWYRPENVSVVLVGDAPPDEYIPLIKKWFGDEKAEAPKVEQKGAEFKPFTKRRAMVVTDPEMPMCQVQLLDIRPGRPATTTVEQWRQELVESIGAWIIGRRYEERVQKGEASYRGAGAGAFNFFNEAMLVSASATGEPADWSKMLDEVVVELKRAQQHGFTERELEMARKEILADAERAVRTESTRNARGVIMEIVSGINEEEPVLSAQQELDLFKELLPDVSLSEVNEAFSGHFKPGTFAYVITLPERPDVTVPERSQVLEIAGTAWAKEVDPVEQAEAPTDILAKLPEPGTVVETGVEEDLKITSGWLDNGVRFHHRFMDYKEDTVMIGIALAGGQIEETAENKGVSQVATLAVNEAATGRLTSTQMRDLLTGVNISVRASAQGDVFLVSVSGSPQDLETGLQVAHAVLTDGKVEESAFNNWKLQTLQMIEFRDKIPAARAMEVMTGMLSGDDPRLTPLKKEHVEALSQSQAQLWFDRLRADAPIEVTVVGEMSLEDAKPLLERYLGSLSKRPRTADHLKPLRKLNRKTGPLAEHIEVETITPQAAAFAGFAASEGENYHDSRALEIASQVLSSRLIKRIREDLSLVYSIRASSNPSWRYRDSGQFVAGSQCDPANAKKVADEIHEQFTKFAQDGPTDEELANAKRQIANNLDDSMKEPSYWLGLLTAFDLHGQNMREEKRIREAFEALTVDEVVAAFKKYYTPERQFRVTAVPKPESAPESVEEKEKEPVS